MGLFDHKNKNGHICMSLTVKSGKEHLNLGIFLNVVKMAQQEDRLVYFDNMPGKLYRLVDYEWDGPRYKTVTTTTDIGNSKSKEKTKRKGGLGGALLGTALMPGAGTLVGYAMTSKKVTKGKGKTKNQVVTNTNDVEVDTISKITLEDTSNRNRFTIGIVCNTKIDNDLDRFNWSDTEMPNTPVQNIPMQSIPVQNTPIQRPVNSGMSEADKVKILKEYKQLLDMGAISQAEFDKKKREILG